MNRTYKDMLVIGFALFSMFFGAGNVIFPPYLGLGCGSQWFSGFVCYYLADIGLALLALFSILRCGGPEAILCRTGQIPSKIFMSAIILCIGPMLAIPRTAATTYEMSLSPLVSGFSPLLFSLLFFAFILILCLKESAVVDIVGKILTPALLIGLLILIVKGILSPIGPIPDRILVESVPVTGIEAGYQTMDVLAAMVFGIIVLKTAGEKGYTRRKDQFQVVAGAGLIAGLALLFVYLGLTYLGVTASSFFDLSVPRTHLVVFIVHQLLGTGGTVLFSMIVALACITTAVALVSSAASYFANLSGNRISYPYLVIGISVFSALVSNVGLDQIVSLASPILSIVYPPALVLILLSLVGHHLKSDLAFQLGALGALLISVLTVASDYGLTLAFLQYLPLQNLGFGWLLPALLFALLGSLLDRSNTSKNM